MLSLLNLNIDLNMATKCNSLQPLHTALTGILSSLYHISFNKLTLIDEKLKERKISIAKKLLIGNK